MVKLKGKRIILRSWKKSDVEKLSKIANDKEIAKNMIHTFPYPYNLNEAKNWIKLANKSDKKKSNFAIEFEGELVGGAGFDLKEGFNEGVASGGYWIGKKFWGKGIATEAWELIRDYAFENFDIRRLQAGIFSWNPASAKIQEKCGFKNEGCLRNAVIRYDEVCDELMYGLLREEWEKLRNK